MHDGDKPSGSSIPSNDVDIAKIDVFGKKASSDFWNEIPFVNYNVLFFKDRIGDLLWWGSINMADEECEVEYFEGCWLLPGFGEQLTQKWRLYYKRLENEDIWENWQDALQ